MMGYTIPAVVSVVAVCALLVALYRHTNDRHELNELKGA